MGGISATSGCRVALSRELPEYDGAPIRVKVMDGRGPFAAPRTAGTLPFRCAAPRRQPVLRSQRGKAGCAACTTAGSSGSMARCVEMPNAARRRRLSRKLVKAYPTQSSPRWQAWMGDTPEGCRPCRAWRWASGTALAPVSFRSCSRYKHRIIRRRARHGAFFLLHARRAEMAGARAPGCRYRTRRASVRGCANDPMPRFSFAEHPPALLPGAAHR